MFFVARKRNKIMKAAAARRQHGALHHIRRSVLLLLGIYNVRLHQGIARYAHEADWVLDDTYVSSGLLPVWWDGDGILGLITNPKDVTAVRHFPECPLVDVSKGWIAKSMPARYRASGLGRPRVYYDNARIARLSAEHFLERGFKHIAFLNCGNYWHEIERIPTYQKVIEGAGAQYHEIEYYRHVPPHSALMVRDYLSAQRWLNQSIHDLPKPLAVTVASDNVSMRLFGACDAAGVSVPEEVAILGCDNDPLICEAAPVPLSSVDTDWDRIGYEAAQLLDRLMAGKPAPRELVLIPPKEIVTRLSTNILAVPDLKIARAVRFIWERHAETIGTPEVALAAGLNRRKLERDFRRFLGRSVGDEITNLRVEHGKKLLLETDLKAYEVAAQCGFSGIVHFSNAFRRLTGNRPSHFRRAARASA